MLQEDPSEDMAHESKAVASPENSRENGEDGGGSEVSPDDSHENAEQAEAEQPEPDTSQTAQESSSATTEEKQASASAGAQVEEQTATASEAAAVPMPAPSSTAGSAPESGPDDDLVTSSLEPKHTSGWGWGLSMEAGSSLQTDLHFVNSGSLDVGKVHFQFGLVVTF